MFRYWVERLSHPFRGLWYAVTHDKAIQIEIALGVIGVPLSYILFGPFTAHELLLLIFCWFFIIVAELQNSAIEIALDRLHPERHPEIGGVRILPPHPLSGRSCSDLLRSSL
jgi:diacylglycerol kinase (ATP)